MRNICGKLAVLECWLMQGKHLWKHSWVIYRIVMTYTMLGWCCSTLNEGNTPAPHCSFTSVSQWYQEVFTETFGDNWNSIFTGQMPFLMLNHQYQSTVGGISDYVIVLSTWLLCIFVIHGTCSCTWYMAISDICDVLSNVQSVLVGTVKQLSNLQVNGEDSKKI